MSTSMSSIKLGAKKEIGIIDAVRQRPCLYDKTCSEYRDSNAKSEAWEEIATENGVAADDVKQFWQNLRNAFASVLNRRRKTTSTEFSKWKYEDNMLFLLPFMDIRNSHAFILGDRVQFLQDDTIDEMSRERCDLPSDPFYQDGDSNYEAKAVEEEESRNSENDQTPNVITPKRKRENTTARKLKEMYRSPVSEFDAIELFYLSMAKITKTLPKAEQAKLRVEVSKIISESEIQTEEHNYC